MTYKKLLSGAGVIAIVLFVLYLVINAALHSDIQGMNESENAQGESSDVTDIAEAVTPNENIGVEVPEAVTETVPAKKDTIVSPTPVKVPVTPTPTTIPEPTTKGYTLAQVGLHTDASSCWSIIGSSVYDLTSFVSQHPGGERRILRICGKDGTSLFVGQHGGQSRPESTLAKYLIGSYLN